MTKTEKSFLRACAKGVGSGYFYALVEKLLKKSASIEETVEILTISDQIVKSNRWNAAEHKHSRDRPQPKVVEACMTRVTGADDRYKLLYDFIHPKRPQ